MATVGLIAGLAEPSTQLNANRQSCAVLRRALADALQAEIDELSSTMVDSGSHNVRVALVTQAI